MIIDSIQNGIVIDHISAGKTHNSCYDNISFTRTEKAYVEGNN